MLEIKLEHSVKGEIRSNPNLESLEINLKRHEDFMGVFFMFSGDVKLKGALKTWVDDCFTTYGLDTIINLTLYQSSSNAPYWAEKTTGIVDGEQYEIEEDYSLIAFEDSEFERKLISRADFEVEYNLSTTIDGTACAGYSDYFQDVLYRGRKDGGALEATGLGVFPFELFDHTISQLTDENYRVFRSTALGRSDATFLSDFGFSYADDGAFAYLMITNGAFISGFPKNTGDTHDEGEVSLYVKFKELAQEFMRVGNLGLGIDKDDEGRKIVVIEPLKEFFLKEVLVEVTDLNNLKIGYDTRYFVKEINNSYQKTEQDNDFGITEYNGKSNFATEITIGQSLDLTNQYRADYSGLITALSNLEAGRSADGGDDVQTDNQIFFAHSYDDAGTIKTVKNEAAIIPYITGIYPDAELFFNLFITPARKMYRHGEIIRIGLDNNDKDAIKYMNSEGASNLESQAYNDSVHIYEKADADKADFYDAYLSGRTFKFDCTLSYSEIDTLIEERIGLIQFYNKNENVTSYGYIDECKIDIISNKVDFTLLEAINLDILARNFLTEGEENMITEDSFILVTE